MMSDLLVDLGEMLAEYRPLAADWHGGQMSALYGFASSGIVSDPERLLAEIDRCIDMADDDDADRLVDMANTISVWLTMHS